MTPVSVAGAVIDAYQIDVKIKTRANYGPSRPISVVLFNAGPVIQIAAFTMAGIAAIDLTDDGVVFLVAGSTPYAFGTPEPADRHDPSYNGDEFPWRRPSKWYRCVLGQYQALSHGCGPRASSRKPHWRGA
jgi:hypothetical protein